jgi:vancomycin resistance protein VanJ
MHFLDASSCASDATSVPASERIARTAKWLTVAYVVALAALLAALEWYGEKNWALSAILYLPAQFWLLPLAILGPFCLLAKPRLCLVHVACIGFLALIYVTCRWTPKPTPHAGTLTLVTNNVGQGNHQSLDPFLQEQNPDVIALQDAGSQAPAYVRKFPERFVKGEGEFVLVSKYPIKTATLLREPAWLGRPVAAAFEISFNGQPLVIYSVHMPTPRPDFAKLRGIGWLKELAGRNRRRSDNRSYAESMAARIDLARALRDTLAAEKQPFLIAGDFNMPDHGFVYHLFASKFQDAFAKRGRGYGLTFPGDTRNPLTLFGPWLRLDYAFAGNGWKPLFCQAEPRRRSQHRAVMAMFAPVGKS